MKLRIFALISFLFFGISTLSASTLFIVSVNQNEVYRYDVGESGSPTLETTITDPSLDRPYGVAINSSGELFVVNRGNGSGGGGNVSRFLDPTGTATPNGVISGSFNLPHGAEFIGDELFVVNSFANNVLRFQVTGSGASANGNISTSLTGGTPRGVLFNPFRNELLVTECCGINEVNRYSLDGGSLNFIGSITGGGLSNSHGMAINAQGDLFVANAGANTISQFSFDAAGVATSQAIISGNGLAVPLDLAFSPTGELFVTSASSTTISRFTFDPSGNALANGTFNAPSITAELVFFNEASIPEPTTWGMMFIGLFAFVIKQRK